MTPTVFLDMDGVLVDFVGGICRALGKPYPYDHPSSFGIWETWKLLGATEAEFWTACHSRVFWSLLDWMPDGKEMLATITERVDPKQVFLLTSPSLSPGSYAGKAEWVQREMPEFSGRLLMGSAKHLLAGESRIMIDDANHNVDGFRASGGEAILVPRPWNRLWSIRESAVGYCSVELNVWKEEVHCG